MKTPQDTHKDRQDVPQQLPGGANKPSLDIGKILTRSLPKPGESFIGSMTIFRANNFFVHAVPRRHKRPSDQTNNTASLEHASWNSAEQRHILESETRLLPDTHLINPLTQKEIVIPIWVEAIVVLLVLAIGMAIHSWGMDAFPAYQQSEGLLMSNAWAITHGQLQPYTYTQTFLGWFQIAGWLDITGGLTTFGNAINSGRALMLVLSTASGLLVYLIANRLSRSRSAGLLALALFDFSPLGITYQREISLDTIGTFWLLLAIYLLVTSDSRLLRIMLASLALGIAILTKEVFIIFCPVMLYAVWLHVTVFQRKFALVVFIFILASLVSTFALFAALKGEVLPTGVLPWDHHPHPSLWEGLIANIQSARQGSDFGTTWNIWMQYEYPFFIASAVAAGINLLMGWRNPLRAFLALALISFWGFLLITNIIFTSYLVIFFPLMALNVAVALNALLKRPKNRFSLDLGRVTLIFALVGVLIPYQIQHTQPLLTANPTNAQTSTSALNWIRSHVPTNSTIIVDSYLYADLHEPEGPDKKAYPYAQIYWNVVLDPDVRFNALQDNWNKIDYIVLDPQMENDIRTHPSDTFLIDQALHHGILVQTFNDTNHDPSAVVQIYQIEHTTI